MLLASGLTLQALGLAWLALAVGTSTPYTDLVPGFIMAGIGMGLTFAPSATAVLADMAPTTMPPQARPTPPSAKSESRSE